MSANNDFAVEDAESRLNSPSHPEPQSSMVAHDNTSSDVDVNYKPPLESAYSHRDVSEYEEHSNRKFHKSNLESPGFGQYRMLIGALMLTTLLAGGSAFDARNACISQEMFSWLDFVDDDTLVFDDTLTQEGTLECLNMFRLTILPVGITTLFFCLLGLIMIQRHLSYAESTIETIIPSPLAALLQLLVPAIVTTIAWTYGIYSIMMKPKKDSDSYKQNPFKSLAAVDQLGHVGDNANLYYLSWMSQTLSMALLYQIVVACFRWRHQGFEDQIIDDPQQHVDAISVRDETQGFLSYAAIMKMVVFYRQRRKTWYQFMLRLRERSGVWVGAFFASFLLLISSAYLYIEVLGNLASQRIGGQDYKYRDVCAILEDSDELPGQFCIRTGFSVMSGSISVTLCLVAMILHVFVRRQASIGEGGSCGVLASQFLPGAVHLEVAHVQLRMEVFLSVCLSFILGLNAIFATGVQGPAATVGNLYYASWLSFLFCLRICLGCLEEIYYHMEAHASGVDETFSDGDDRDGKSLSSALTGGEVSIDSDKNRKWAIQERPNRLRKYFFLAIFSTVCAASAWDAACNQEGPCSNAQKYMIFAPLVIGFVSTILFFLCLGSRSYLFVSRPFCGGILSIVCFQVWLANLVITMHGEDSWAVNSIGEMKLANLYYYSWASIVTAGLQMMSYVKPYLGQKAKGNMVLVWGAIVKVSMVILGAGLHVWHKIGESCTEGGNLSGATTFCSRTVLAIGVGVTGVVTGWAVLGSRVISCSLPSRIQARVEAVLSVILVLIFGVAVALITSIGGPGQSVGDLYYSTWLAFWVCIGIFVSALDQMNEEDIISQADKAAAVNEAEYYHFVEAYEAQPAK